jgi:hypothetical protein
LTGATVVPSRIVVPVVDVVVVVDGNGDVLLSDV